MAGRSGYLKFEILIPLRSILSFTLSASVLGMAQGGLEVFSETIQGRVSGRTGGKFAESVGLR